MKKRIWSLLLCLVLVFSLAACGDKDKDETDEKSSGKKETVKDVKPEDMVSVKFKEFADQITEAFDKTGTANNNNSQGMDLDVSVEPGADLLKTYGLEGVKSVALKLAVDVMDATNVKMAGDLLLNDKQVIDLESIVNPDKVFVKIPLFSDEYAGLPLDEIADMAGSGISIDLGGQTEGLPTPADLKKIWVDFSDSFIDCFKFEEKIEKASIGSGDYAVEADKYVTKASMEDVKAVFEKFVKDLEKYPALNVDSSAIDTTTDVKDIKLIYYVNKNDETVWELVSNKEDETRSIVIMDAKKGRRVYSVDEDGSEEVLLYSVKESDKKGKIVFNNDGDEIVFNYDNYSKNYVDVSTEIEGVTLTLGIDTKDNGAKVSFKVEGNGMDLDGKLVFTEKSISVEAHAVFQGIEIGTIKISGKNRDVKKFSVPSDALDMDEWTQSLDQSKLMNKLQELMNEFPFIQDLIMNMM